MGKRPLTFGEKLQQKVNEINRRQEKNLQLYAEACKKQGVKLGEPIDIMKLVEKKK
jgi:hypothetical protein